MAMNRYIALEEEADWDEFAVDLGWMFEGAEEPSVAEEQIVMIDRSGDPGEGEPDCVLDPDDAHEIATGTEE